MQIMISAIMPTTTSVMIESVPIVVPLKFELLI